MAFAGFVNSFNNLITAAWEQHSIARVAEMVPLLPPEGRERDLEAGDPQAVAIDQLHLIRRAVVIISGTSILMIPIEAFNINPALVCVVAAAAGYANRINLLHRGYPARVIQVSMLVPEACAALQIGSYALGRLLAGVTDN